MYAHAQAPVRIGIAGGGTDLPVWTSSGKLGQCLSIAIKAYTHAVAIARPDKQVVATYRQRDVAASATEIANGLIRESALLHGWEDGFEVHTLSELSSRGSGLGVSSSISVALAACFSRMAALRNGISTEPKWQDGGETAFRNSIARDAWTVEIDRLRRPIGRQDHMAATHGGLRLYSFEHDSATIERTFSKEDTLWLASHIALVELPEGHDSRSILSQVTKTDMLNAAANAVPLAVRAIETRDKMLLGRALSYCQESKLAIPGATPPWLVDIVNTILKCHGVLGCKVAGAGGGGHVIVAFEDKTVTEIIAKTTSLPVTTVAPDLEGVKSEAWA